jgi:uncharacterized membrane protein YhaH (DUF805 family)
MSMTATMLNPGGRLGPTGFRNASLILIVIGTILSILSVLSPAMMMLGFVSLALIYPWVVIWSKRLHDAGKSGWMFLLVLVLYLIATFTVSYFIGQQFGPPVDPNADLEQMMATMTATAQATAIPSTVASVVISLAFVFAGNALLKSDPGPNAYGPAPA